MANHTSTPKKEDPLTDISPDTQTPRLARRQSAPATGTDTVTVACNLPNGHILQIYHIEEVETVLPNGRVFRENIATLDQSAGQYALNGAQLDYGALQGGSMPDYRVIKGSAPGTGFALTSGIPRDFWDRWLANNANSPLVKNRHIFASSTEARAADEAREYKDFKSGFQGLNPAGDYRVPSGRGVRKYSPTDNRMTPEQSELAPE